MVMTDPIADMLSRVRNANTVRHEKLDIPASKVKTQIAEILKREGYVRNYEIIEDNKQNIIRIFMKYGNNDEQVIRGLKRISKPGLRVYANANEVPSVLNGLGTADISTSNGVLSDKDARAHMVGGGVLRSEERRVGKESRDMCDREERQKG